MVDVNDKRGVVIRIDCDVVKSLYAILKKKLYLS